MTSWKSGLKKIAKQSENLVQTGGFSGEWGLSFLLEVEDAEGRDHKIISDTGSSKETILHNIKRLKLEIVNFLFVVVIYTSNYYYRRPKITGFGGTGGILLGGRKHNPAFGTLS